MKGSTYTQRLRAEFACRAIERYALGVVERDRRGQVTKVITGGMDRGHRRRMRNARKRERQEARS